MTGSTETVFDFSVAAADGTRMAIADRRGDVLLIVNTASRCGFTGQYVGLQALQDRFGARGFSVLAFPCDQFGGQEPGTDAEIQDFCTTRFDVSFPVLAKIAVNGPAADPLYAYLKRAARGLFGSRAIKWNFTKFLVGADGVPIHRYGPRVSPEAIAPAIEHALGN